MATSTATNVEEEEYHCQYAMQLASASVLPMALKAATDLGVFEIIEKAGPGVLLSSSQIASQLAAPTAQMAPLLLDRILLLLASNSILTCSVTFSTQDGQLNRLYGLAPVAKYFIKDQDGGCLAPFLATIHDKVILDTWYHLKDAVVEGGGTFEKAHGMRVMEYMGKDMRFGEKFKGSMRDFNTLLMHRILDIYDGFQGLKSLVDVGGGDGSLLNMIVSKYPSIKGTNYDLASVIEKSPSYTGIEHVAGDMFVSVPKGEAIFIKWVLHMWDDQACLKVLKNCYEALPSNGKVIVVDLVVPETTGANAADKSVLQTYLLFTNMNPKRKDRTEREFKTLAKEAGFSHVQVASRAFSFSVVEFLKHF
ncbi:hypothetical protein P3X46_012170 [Hevea brasiliensis]|uniref:Uncharacterized protein n=1 Tax=Hevea brasiliensis TaxID=3981 RepID=A0ABQ9M9T5_HEVBR|nr:caffeic acid 3-O-methyltransferase [Hevea brasiliensis]KAJ9176906.1 hypothetical protein P3X46_012170 [Hevea brasiliensis]